MSEKIPERSQERISAARTLATEIVIEFADPNNRQATFPPLQERMRSRWDSRALPVGTSMHESLARMPVIPGLWIKVHTKNMTGERLDPLGFPENQALAGGVSAAYKNMFGRPAEALQPVKRDLDQNELASWVYWMWRHVKAGQAELRRGEFPAAVNASYAQGKKDILAAFPGAVIREDYYDAMMVQESPTAPANQMAATGAA